MLLKRACFEIKIFCFTDRNGYLHRFSVYTGKQDPPYNVDALVPEGAVKLSLTAKTTIALMVPFLNKGYHLFTDDWYISVALYEYLHQHSTARSDSMPKALKNLDIDARKTKSLYKVPLLSQKFLDKKMVYSMTTGHTTETKTRR
ncbi:PiggyBac transposase Kobuta [Elysia marginata]|uniref:PiggyBac transposase Kobuta n=1 Tax=Elysia marginata TaxID=1093978 RepID=A0AAV4HS21_9GAST|nr:PiggyBac transposase Kobuta [Elysia marginata]